MKLTRTTRLGLLAAAVALGGCGADAPSAPAPSGIIALYGDRDSSELTPYPSNRYTVADVDSPTGLRVDIPEATPDLVNSAGLEETVAELEQMDGFSTTAGVLVQFDGPVDVTGIALRPDELPEQAPPLAEASFYTELGAPMHLVDVDPDSPEQGRLIGLLPSYWEQEPDDYYTSAEYTLIALPAEPLRPRTRYLFVVTSDLKAGDGGHAHPAADMEAVLRGEGDQGADVVAAIEVLAQALGSTPDIALATTFTTASIHETMLTLADDIRHGPAPTLVEPWEVETPEQDGRIRFRATYAANEYRAPQPDGRFVMGPDGVPLVQDVVDLEVFMAVSDANTDAKRPIVIFGHGLAGDKDGCWGTAQRLAPLNAAVFAIDSPFHGSRGDGGDTQLDAVFSFFGIDAGADPPTFVIGRSRDNFRQMAADQLELIRLIKSLDSLDILPPGNPDGVADLDTSRILYIGHSFGSVQGPMIFGIAPEISHAVWNVGGAGLMLLLRDSNTFGILVNGLKPQGTPDGAVARFMTVAQAIVDPGDPLNFARFAQRTEPAMVPDWQPREVLLQEVVGDTIVPNSVSRFLARATGLQLIDPLEPVTGLESVSGPVMANLPSGVTGGMSQFDKINGDDIAVHGELYFAPEGIAQYLEFFQTGLSNPHATIPSAY